MIIFTKEKNGKYFVYSIHYRPELLTEEQKAQGYEVEAIPESEYRKGYVAHLYYNPERNELYYEYEKIHELSIEEEIAQLKAKLAELEAQLDEQ